MKGIIANAYVSYIDEEAEMRGSRVYHVKYESVCIEFLNQSPSRLLLNPGKKYEDKTNADPSHNCK